MTRALLYRVFRALAWVLVQMFARALRATSSSTAPISGTPDCVACRRPVPSSRLPEVGELTVGGTCSEACAVAVIDGAARRHDAATAIRATIWTATRSCPAPSQETTCPGPDCSLCNGEVCMRCLPISGAPPCDHDVVERHQSVAVRGELRELDERRRPRN